MNQQDIEQVVKAVLLKMQSSDTPPAAVHEMGVFASLDDAVAAAKVAQQGLKSVAMRQLAIAAIREAGEKHARDLAELAVSETGMGRVEDKFAKNVAQARGTPGVECLSPQVLTGDNGLTLIENAPWGVVASVTPSTNPAATVINNAISLIAAGNSVIFAPHPAAKKVSQRAITLLNQAIVAAGGPENLLVTVANPDIETAQRLFKFPGIGLLVVTGGEAVVEAARKHTNKRLIAAGAGNPPVVVDETADLARAARNAFAVCGNHCRTSVCRDRTDDAGAARRARRQRGGCHCAGGETGRRLPPHGGNALAQHRKHEPDGECY
ncbi:acetaldehyde dehydrogenase [Shigella flexneri K-315]|uniref:Acetaldehyde dehydrogenase n=1 Tax=Shigella flexneri K-315 TaxID=766150 RepID=I6CIS6_SHIFL|nr:acetaldehyde dehydrogenase [Shigella flexneri K-315]